MTDQATPPVLVRGRDTCEDTVRSRDLLVRLGVPVSLPGAPAADLPVAGQAARDRVAETDAHGVPAQPEEIVGVVAGEVGDPPADGPNLPRTTLDFG